RVVKAIAKNNTKNNASAVVAAGNGKAASRAEMEARFALLPEHVKKGLMAGDYQLSDHTIVGTKSVSRAKTVKMFEESDAVITGLCNLNQAKLGKNEYFLLSGMVLLHGVSTGGPELTQTNISEIPNWDIIPHNIANGEFEVGANGKTLFKQLSTRPFANFIKNTGSISNSTPEIVGGYGYAFGEGQPGFVKFANPKLIEPMDPIKVPIEWIAAADENAFLRIELYGTIVRTY
ncbi:MAG: hypothetical protein PHE56_08170, partial [Bacteroidales bacterium]|nr:hypothetical protein [Bacteroidales bacterium]